MGHRVIGDIHSISGLENDASPDSSADYAIFFDTSLGVNKKTLIENFGGGGGDSFTTIQTDAGTSPVADSSTDTLTLTSSTSMTITGDSSTDTVTLELASSISSNHTFTGIIYFDQLTDRQSSGTGFRSYDANIMQLYHNGSAKANYTSSGVSYINYGIFLSQSGAAGALNLPNTVSSSSFCAMRFTSDSDCGAYRIGANNWALVCGAVDVFTFTSTLIQADVPISLKQYATGSLPTASSYEGAIVYDSTTNEFKGSDGSSWNVLG